MEEKKSELFLSNGNTNVAIKQEPLPEEFFNEGEALSSTIEESEVVKVKKEPLEDEEEEEGPVSAVLRSKVILLLMQILKKKMSWRSSFEVGRFRLTVNLQ